MKTRVIFAEHNFCLVDFYSILKDSEPNLITDLHNYGLLQNKKITKDAKALILHHLIFQTCEHILKYKNKEKNVIYYSAHIPKIIELLKYYNSIELEKTLSKIINQFKKILPLRIHSNHLSFKEIINSANGERAELISRIKVTLQNTDINTFSFSKTYSFTKRNKLNFLNKEYFQSIKTKQLLLA